MSARAALAPHGYVGAGIIILAEALLFTGDRVVGQWFTPIVWTGYVLLADAFVYRLRGHSPLVSDRTAFLIMALISILAWWMFEFYNAPRFWRSDRELWWHYHNLEPNPFLRRVGYDWAFATIFPALFLTAEVLLATVFRHRPRMRPVALSRTALRLMSVIGAAMALLPLVVISEWFAPLVWLAFIFLVDPINALRDWPSICGDLMRGDWRRLTALLVSGFVCGILWEFWNYWAISRWTYTVPYLGHIKIFEMPVLGYFGFPPFAVECWAIYIFCRSLLAPPSRMADDTVWMPTRD
ncbi:MAG: hypothetical protein C4334_07785 [Pyrinomonas sp.]|uniref:hypothetical protein n=1 Tax=Pyrinomonas sp. TaxID=2080306 RepID=UPI003324BDAB